MPRFRSLPAVLTLLLPGLAALGADEPGPPIPQDRQRQAKRNREIYSWLMRTTADVYQKSGNRNPKWDKAVLEVFASAAKYSAPLDEHQETRAMNLKKVQRAIDLGCDDGWILYLSSRFASGPGGPGPEETLRRMEAAREALVHSKYPPARRASALFRLGWMKSRPAGDIPANPDEARTLLDAALACFPESVRDDEPGIGWDLHWSEGLALITEGYTAVFGNEPEAFERVDAVVAKFPDLKWLRLQLKGTFLIHQAWAARGSGFADKVTELGAQAFDARLKEAREALEASWKLQPNQSRTATLMLDVEKGIGGDRPSMERWFQRAMETDMDNRVACVAKMDWLDPKWHGSREELLEFGRACRASGNWRVGIILLLADAHQRIGYTLPPEERRDYYHLPLTWHDFRSVYVDYLAHPHDIDEVQSSYAAVAVLCGHYDVANAEFAKIGDRLIGSRAFSVALLKQYREFAAEVVKKREDSPSNP